MPQSRNRPGHQYHKPADIPASQRVKGRLVWAILFAVFGLGISFFAAGPNWLLLSLAAIVSAIIGYFAGKNMEQEAKT